MELETRNAFICHHCDRTFPRRHINGRKPHYCTRTCRQRAYEQRRRGARFPAPDPEAALALPPARPAAPHYESGRNRRISHALRPGGLPDRYRRRTTLCGAWAAPVRPPFGRTSGPRDHVCRVCRWVAGRHPPPRAVDPPTDLAVLTHLVSRLGPAPEHRLLFSYCGLSAAGRPGQGDDDPPGGDR